MFRPRLGGITTMPASAPGTTTSVAFNPAGIATNRWKAIPPGAADHESFNDVGHCLFALLAGLIGLVFNEAPEAVPTPKTRHRLAAVRRPVATRMPDIT
jgi:hypothetical protein